MASVCKLIVGNSYCVEENFGIPRTTTAAASSTAAATTTGISTPQPIQTGMVSNCNSFYLVKAGDECADIASSHGISLSNFYAWNPAVGSTCNTLWAATYVCVGLFGSTSTLTITAGPTTAAPGNGITTPSPIQTGMITSCNTFYLVKSGDSCGNIASSYGISLSDFYAWNTGVGSACQTLWSAAYVCVNIIGRKTPPTATTKGNGVATPSPTQAGMSGSCKKFHLVVSGDECGVIATNAGISLSDFYAWNTGVGKTCATLFLGYYVCIGV